MGFALVSPMHSSTLRPIPFFIAVLSFVIVTPSAFAGDVISFGAGRAKVEAAKAKAAEMKAKVEEAIGQPLIPDTCAKASDPSPANVSRPAQ